MAEKKYNSRRIKQGDTISGIAKGQCYCRRCQKVKLEYEFHKSVDMRLDNNGFLSICKQCVGELYADALVSEGSVREAILKLCRMLNIAYNETAIDSAETQAKSRNIGDDKLFGVYRAKLLLQMRTSVSDTNVDMTYVDNPIININAKVPSEVEVEEAVVIFWGTGYETEEYRWLESNLEEWKKSHRCDTMAELTLLKEIVFKLYEIDKSRKSKGSTASSVKELQELMKTANIDPAKASSGSKGNDTFSSFIKLIESGEPAEVWGDERDAFKDFGNIRGYFLDYITRPLSNFIRQSRDFSLTHEQEEEDKEYENLETMLPDVPEIDDNDIKQLDTGVKDDE